MKNKVDAAFRAFMALTEDEKKVLFAKMILSDRPGMRFVAKAHGVGVERIKRALVRATKGEEMWRTPPPITPADLIAKITEQKKRNG